MKDERQGRRGWIVGVIATGTVVMLVTVWSLYRNTAGYWDRLESAQRVFETTNSVALNNFQRSGSTFCAITCGSGGEATLKASFSFSVSDVNQARNVSMAMLERAYGVSPELELGTTVPHVRVPSVGSGAYAQLESRCPEHSQTPVTCTAVLVVVSGIE